jgi:ADP-ribosylglycohydrolase
MNENAKAMVLASFAADALSLGVHWIYNTNDIDKKWGRVEGYIKPERPTYHPTKDLGELTHYGDQTLLLLKSITGSSGFDLNHFANRWQKFFKNYEGYFDGATKATLENFAAGKGPADVGSDSDDLAGAARIAPLAFFYRNDLKKFTAAARAQTALTHNNRTVIETAEFFGRVVWQVLHGEAPTAAIKQALVEGFDRRPFANWVSDGLNSVETNTRQAMLNFGKMCEIEAAFPCVVHLIARYADNLKEGLIENAMAGGDSAGRGLIVGMILGAHLGIDAIPLKWISELKSYQEIADLMEQIDRNRIGFV